MYHHYTIKYSLGHDSAVCHFRNKLYINIYFSCCCWYCWWCWWWFI